MARTKRGAVEDDEEHDGKKKKKAKEPASATSPKAKSKAAKDKGKGKDSIEVTMEPKPKRPRTAKAAATPAQVEAGDRYWKDLQSKKASSSLSPPAPPTPIPALPDDDIETLLDNELEERGAPGPVRQKTKLEPKVPPRDAVPDVASAAAPPKGDASTSTSVDASKTSPSAPQSEKTDDAQIQPTKLTKSETEVRLPPAPDVGSAAAPGDASTSVGASKSSSSAPQLEETDNLQIQPTEPEPKVPPLDAVPDAESAAAPPKGDVSAVAEPVDEPRATPGNAEAAADGKAARLFLDYSTVTEDWDAADGFTRDDVVDLEVEIERAKKHPLFDRHFAEVVEDVGEYFDWGDPNGDQAEDLISWIVWLNTTQKLEGAVDGGKDSVDADTENFWVSALASEFDKKGWALGALIFLLLNLGSWTLDPFIFFRNL